MREGGAPGAVLLVDEASRLYVVPGNPGPERSPNGVPMLSLIGSTQEASLQVGVRWWPEADELAGLTSAIALALGRDPTELLVSADAVSVSRVALIAGGDGSEGDPVELATSESSGTAPFDTIFSAPVASAQLDLVRQAFGGARDLLRVRLEGAIAAGTPCVTTILSAPIDAALVELVASVQAPAGLESRIVSGAVRRTRIELDGIDPGMRQEADRRAAENFLRDAATTLATAGAAEAPGSTNGEPVVLRAMGSVPLPSARSIVREADVAEWIPASGGTHVFLLPSPVPADPHEPSGLPGDDPGSSATRRVSLSFRPTGAPLRVIDVTAGSSEARLEPPFEAPAFLATEALAVHVTSRFTDGPSYERDVERHGEGWTLAPADVGLVEIRLEAAEPATPGTLDVDAFYQPSDQGSADRRSIHLPDAAGKWSASWFVASRAPDLAGALVVTVTGAADGGQQLPSRTIHATEPTIKV